MKKTVGKDGGVLVMVMVVMLAFSVLAFGLFKLHETDAVETVYVKQSAEAFWVAEAGLQSTLAKLRRRGQDGKDYRALVSTIESNPSIESGTVGNNGAYQVAVWGDGSNSNFWMKSQGTVMGQDRLIALSVVLNAFGPHGLITLDGNSILEKDITIDADIYQNGTLTTKSGVTVTGNVLADNHEDFDPNGYPIPEDGELELSIQGDFFTNNYFSLTTNAASISVTNTLDLMNGTVVVDSSVDPSLIISTGSSGGTNIGVLVVKGDDQTFTDDLVIGDNITIAVQGDLKISKNGTFGTNVTLFATGTIDLFKNADATSTTGAGCAVLALGDVKVWKDFTFEGIVFTEGRFDADMNLDVTGTIINRDGFKLKKDATATFNEGAIPQSVLDGLISYSFIVNQSLWNELPIP